MTDEESRELYRDRCGYQVLLPDGSVKNVLLREVEAGALRELVDAGATFPRPMQWLHERPYADYADTDVLCTDGWPFSRDRYEAACVSSRERKAAYDRDPLTVENAAARAWASYDHIAMNTLQAEESSQ